jgi:type IV secretion system protein VirD4
VGTLIVTITSALRQLKRFFYPLAVVLSWWNAVFGKSAALYKARFASDHEVADLTTDSLPTDSLLVGITHFFRFLHVRATKQRRELGNILIEAPTWGGKGLLAVSQLLTWGGSAVVFDIKGDLYDQTAGYRKTLGDVFRFDTRGYGDPYDPLQGKYEEDDFYALAKHLLYEPNEGDGKAFTQRATKMLTLLWLAGLELNRLAGEESHYRLLPFVGKMADLGINSAASIIHSISPTLARRLLDGEYNPETDYDERKYLANSWESLTARLYPLLTQRILRCFAGSAFTGADIIAGKKPVTLYLCFPEKDLFAKAPVITLVLESLMAEMLATHDDSKGRNCRQTLILLDEAGTVGLPSLPQYVSTVRSRRISVWAAYQDNSQIDSQYGLKAKAIRNNMDTKIFYRQSSYETAKDIAESLGYRSDYARSQTLRNGEATSESLSEHAVSLLTPRDINELDPDEIIALHSNRKPIMAKRMNWQHIPLLVQRRDIAPPKVWPLPPLKDIKFRAPAALPADEILLDDPDNLVDPDAINWPTNPLRPEG